jgi:hypothetical protein
MNARLHSKWTANYDEISRLYISGKTINAACIKAKIHPSTYYKICKALNKESIAKERIDIQLGGAIHDTNNDNLIKPIKTIDNDNSIKTTKHVDTKMFWDSWGKLYDGRINGSINSSIENKVIPIQTPDIKTPDIETPDIKTPDIKTPDMGTPIQAPDMGTPIKRTRKPRPKMAKIQKDK